MSQIKSSQFSSDIRGYVGQEKIPLFRESAFEKMEKAGKFASQVLDFITPYVIEGAKGEILDQLCRDFIVSRGGIPAPLNYHGFPKSICVSINDVVCHGIPDHTLLNNGDIVNIDVTVILDGWYGDTSRTFLVGDVSDEGKKLVQVTYEAMMEGISLVRPGVTLGDIGHVIQRHVEKNGFSVVRDYCGHGIGFVFHGPPHVLHYGEKNRGLVLEEGMFFTVEPMVNAKGHETVLQKDQWTVKTKDGGLSAQFEHSLGVTKDGYKIFTLS